MVVRNDYEVSSEGGVRHWTIPYARLENVTPTPTQPAMMVSAVLGSGAGGTVLTVDAAASLAIVDFTSSMVYKHFVRNVITYDGGQPSIENAWRAINIGDTIYYDDTATMPADVFLSTSPLNNAGAANSIFGWRVKLNEADTAALGGVIASTQTCAVMQRGAR
jgi:hypothetical protein